VPDSETLPDEDARRKYYYNTINQNAYIYTYNGVFNVDGIKNTSKVKYLGYNGPDTKIGLGMLDYCMRVGNYNMIYKSIAIYDYTTYFRLVPRNVNLLRGDVIPFRLELPHQNPNVRIYLSQNGEIMNFENNTSKSVRVGMYIPISFAPSATVPPSLALYITLAPFFYKISAGAYNIGVPTSMLTNIYDTFLCPPNSTSLVQIYAEPGAGDVLFQTVDPDYYLGFITLY
jgi:hypothetical protein